MQSPSPGFYLVLGIVILFCCSPEPACPDLNSRLLVSARGNLSGIWHVTDTWSTVGITPPGTSLYFCQLDNSEPGGEFFQITNFGNLGNAATVTARFQNNSPCFSIDANILYSGSGRAWCVENTRGRFISETSCEITYHLSNRIYEVNGKMKLLKAN